MKTQMTGNKLNKLGDEYCYSDFFFAQLLKWITRILLGSQYFSDRIKGFWVFGQLLLTQRIPARKNYRVVKMLDFLWPF